MSLHYTRPGNIKIPFQIGELCVSYFQSNQLMKPSQKRIRRAYPDLD